VSALENYLDAMTKAMRRHVGMSDDLFPTKEDKRNAEVRRRRVRRAVAVLFRLLHWFPLHTPTLSYAVSQANKSGDDGQLAFVHAHVTRKGRRKETIKAMFAPTADYPTEICRWCFTFAQAYLQGMGIIITEYLAEEEDTDYDDDKTDD